MQIPIAGQQQSGYELALLQKTIHSGVRIETITGSGHTVRHLTLMDKKQVLPLLAPMRESQQKISDKTQ